jgi:hypothetical protein
MDRGPAVRNLVKGPTTVPAPEGRSANTVGCSQEASWRAGWWPPEPANERQVALRELFCQVSLLNDSWQERLSGALETECGVSLAYGNFLSTVERLGCCEVEELEIELPASKSEALEQLREAIEREDCRLAHWRCYPQHMRQIRLTPKGRRQEGIVNRLIEKELVLLSRSTSSDAIFDLGRSLCRLRKPALRIVL